MNQLSSTGILSSKYDARLDYHISMYDNLPYQRDSDYCNAEKLALESGHIIKYYLCKNQQKQFLVNNHDDEIEEILAGIESRERSRKQTIETEVLEEPQQTGITPEQIQTLLEDNNTPDTEDAEEEIPANTANSFEGVDDW